MPLRDDLLTPIPGDNPSGTDLRYEPIYDKIKEAAREDIIPPPDGSLPKVADWQLVYKLAGEALAKQSKDLQLAAWLTLAQLYREAFPGLRDGLALITGLLDQYWDTLYPALDDEAEDEEEKLGPRLGALSALQKDDFRIAVRLRPVTRGGHTLEQYTKSQGVPTEAEAADSEKKSAARAQAIAEGRLTPEDLEKAIAGTPRLWFFQFEADVAASLANLDALEAAARTRFGDDLAPTFPLLREVLEDVARAGRTLYRTRAAQDPPKPGDADYVEGAPPDLGDDVAGDVGVVSAGAARSGPLTPEPTSVEDASQRIASAARFIRRADPQNPGPYLMLRGLRWGELRAPAGAEPKLLDAPPTAVRTKLKTLLLDENWPELLDECEEVMATPYGRGWLDLQRYALTACENLGAGYEAVGDAITGALRALLRDVPQLPELMLMDDTPTANAQTRAWLATVAPAGGAAGGDGADGNGNGAHPARARRAGDVHARAMSDVKSGRAERAIELLMREAARERSKRARFIRQMQLVEVMIAGGHQAVAQPILEELMPLIEAHKLDDWEDLDLLALMHRCLEQIGSESPLKHALFLRMCRLDPVQAILLAQQGASAGDGAAADGGYGSSESEAASDASSW